VVILISVTSLTTVISFDINRCILTASVDEPTAVITFNEQVKMLFLFEMLR